MYKNVVHTNRTGVAPAKNEEGVLIGGSLAPQIDKKNKKIITANPHEHYILENKLKINGF